MPGFICGLMQAENPDHNMDMYIKGMEAGRGSDQQRFICSTQRLHHDIYMKRGVGEAERGSNRRRFICST
jgi:hypothetical protein